MHDFGDWLHYAHVFVKHRIKTIVEVQMQAQPLAHPSQFEKKIVYRMFVHGQSQHLMIWPAEAERHVFVEPPHALHFGYQVLLEHVRRGLFVVHVQHEHRTLGGRWTRGPRQSLVLSHDHLAIFDFGSFEVLLVKHTILHGPFQTRMQRLGQLKLPRHVFRDGEAQNHVCHFFRFARLQWHERKSTDARHERT